MNPANSESTARRFGDWPLALKSILGFWLFYALTVAMRAALGADPVAILQNKMVIIAVGILLTGLVYAAIALFGRNGPGIARKAIVAGIASIAAAFAMASLLFLAEDHMRKSREEFRYEAREGVVVVQRGNQVRVERRAAEPLVLTLPRARDLDRNLRLRLVADGAVVWMFFFAAWSAFYLAVLAQRQALGAQRAAAAAETAAQAAQVRALRYQINPHFLFNTLNSLSSLVMSGRPEEAEAMLLKLSTFFRSSLSLDPSADVSLAEEIELQRLYLDIERVRFPKRLKVAFDIPSDLENARLPALILQPIVENAIKYGVAPTRDVVTLKITAREAGPGRFTIEIVNGGGSAPARRREAPDGVGVGLGNVRQRLQARFGAAARVEFGPIPEGGYRVFLTLPLDRADG